MIRRIDPHGPGGANREAPVEDMVDVAAEEGGGPPLVIDDLLQPQPIGHGSNGTLPPAAPGVEVAGEDQGPFVDLHQPFQLVELAAVPAFGDAEVDEVDVDENLFGDAVSIASAATSWTQIDEIAPENVGKPIWSLLGQTDPEDKTYYLALNLVTGGTAAGDVAIRVDFAV